MRALCLFVASLSLLCAILQYNDPDPMLWGAYYVALAMFALLCSFGFRLKIGFISLVMASVSLLMNTWPGVQQYLNNKDGQTLGNAMSKEFPYIEQTREFGGALLGLATVVFCFVASRYIASNRRRNQIDSVPNAAQAQSEKNA